MNGSMSKRGSDGLRRRLDEAVVLRQTVEQLRKDLREPGLALPATGEKAFEDLRAQVLAVLRARESEGGHAFGLVINRVDLTERQLQQLLKGGLNDLAAAVVLRCLQKVLSRMRYAGLA